MEMAISGVTVHGTGQHVTLVQPAGPPDTALAVLTSVTHSGTAGPAGDTRRCVRYVRATLRLETTCWSPPAHTARSQSPAAAPWRRGQGAELLRSPPTIGPASTGGAGHPATSSPHSFIATHVSHQNTTSEAAHTVRFYRPHHTPAAAPR